MMRKKTRILILCLIPSLFWLAILTISSHKIDVDKPDIHVIPSKLRISSLTTDVDKNPTINKTIPSISQLKQCQDKLESRPENLAKNFKDHCNNIKQKATKVDKEVIKNLIISFPVNLVYCQVSKAASTSFREALSVALTGRNDWKYFKRSKNYVRSGSYWADSVPYEQLSHFLQIYVKFAVGRNPYDRLVSAYNNKIVPANSIITKPQNLSLQNQQIQGRHLLTQEELPRKTLRKELRIPLRNMKRENASSKLGMAKPVVAFAKQHHINISTGITFETFLKYIISQYQARKLLDIHWRPFYQLCSPCLINYDYIAKYEDLPKASEVFMDLIYEGLIPQKTHFPMANIGKQSSQDQWKIYYKNCDKKTLHQLEEIYAPDFAMFGYEKDLTF